MLAGIPDDSTVAFRGLDNRISTNHIEGYFNVATAVGERRHRHQRAADVAGRQLRDDDAAGRELPGRVPGVVRQARLPAPADQRRDDRDARRRDGELARRRANAPRRSATWS